MTGAQIRHTRKVADITQEELAVMARVNRDYISKLEHGYIPPYGKDAYRRVTKAICEIAVHAHCLHTEVEFLGTQRNVSGPPLKLYNCKRCKSTITR